jgi:phosphate ABC transporter phosphate-binding protein
MGTGALAAVCAMSLGAVLPASAGSYVPISGAGSTWSYNAIFAWTTNVAQYGMVVNYAKVGSTSGRQEFKDGVVDFGASEIPYGVRDGNNYDPPPTNRGYAYMPDTAGGTTFMYNLTIGTHRVTNLRLSGAVLAGIFTGVITRWNDRRIARDNPGLTLPAIQIVPVVRSDGSGATAEFTQWMLATERSYWLNYCRKVGRNPCTQTSAYPVLPGSAMIGQPGDLGVAGYVSQQQANGAIGYVEYSYALETGFPVALVLNRAGYYTEPTPGHVAVSLLKAKINKDKSSPRYLTQDLSQVYTNTDPRNYELSSYSYMILPTDTRMGMNTAKGYTLGAFGSYLLCQGQSQVDALGYSALPINLVKAGYYQLQKIPGAREPTATTSFIRKCHNPTFSTNGTNTLAKNDPFPPACDKKGPVQCSAGTGGAHSPTPTSPGPSPPGGSPTPGGPGGSTSPSPGPGGYTSPPTGPGGAIPPGGSTIPPSACAPDQAGCTATSSGSGSVPVYGSAPGQQVNAVPVSSPVSLGDGVRVALMALAAAMLLGLGLAPPIIAQASRRRRQRRGNLPQWPGDAARAQRAPPGVADDKR